MSVADIQDWLFYQSGVDAGSMSCCDQTYDAPVHKGKF